MEAIEKAGYVPSKDVKLALDVAASEFYENGMYQLKGEGKTFTSDELIDFYKQLVEEYPIISIEDPVDEMIGKRSIGSPLNLAIKYNLSGMICLLQIPNVSKRELNFRRQMRF